MSLIESLWTTLRAQGKASQPTTPLNPYSGILYTLSQQVPITVSCAPLTPQSQHKAEVLACFNHPNIVKVIDYSQFQHEGRAYLAVIEEFLDMTLEKEVKNRLKNALYLRQDMMTYAQGLIEALAWLQEQGIAHRSITPENIFITKPDRLRCPGDILLKIGNFWWCKENVIDEEENMTPIEASVFSSPLILAAYRDGTYFVRHNAFKSDVFSLGSLLQYLRIVVIAPQNPVFEEMVSWMIAPSEDNRPTFVELRYTYFEAHPQSLEPGSPVSEEQPEIGIVKSNQGSYHASFSATQETSEYKITAPGTATLPHFGSISDKSRPDPRATETCWWCKRLFSKH